MVEFWAFGQEPMDPGQVENQATKAARLMWKFFFYAYEADQSLKGIMDSASSSARNDLQGKARDKAFGYCMARAIDTLETHAPKSPFRDHIADLMVAAGRSGEVFPIGSNEAALGIGTCLMAYDGWHAKSEQDEMAFKNAVLDVGFNNPQKQDVMGELVDLIDTHFQFTGELDESVFAEVDDFKDRNRSFSAFLTLAD